MKHVLIVFFLVALSITSTIAQVSYNSVNQEFNSTNFLQGGYQLGYILATNDFVKGENQKGEPIRYYHSARLEYGWQTHGSEAWQQIWGYPYFGFGFYGVDYFNDVEIGTPISIYGYVNWPLERWENWSFNLGLGFGFSWNWKPFDPVANPYNRAIGAFKAAHIDIGFHLIYNLSKSWNLLAAFTGTHFSNGGTNQPNSGLNQVGALFMLRYNIQKDNWKFKKWIIPEYEPNSEWIVLGSAGIRNVIYEKPESEIRDSVFRVDYAVITLSTTYLRQISYKSKFGGGIDLVYDASTGGQLDAGDGNIDAVEIPFRKQIRVGLYGSYEFVLYRLAVLFNIGYSVIQTEAAVSLPRLYQRLGVKYYFLDNVFGGLNVRFKEFGRATHLEFNFGYSIKF